MSAPVPYNPVPASTPRARDVAVWLLGESAAHRVDPIVSCEPVDDRVQLTVCPARENVWRTWCNLLRADATTFDQDAAHATGKWRGVPVEITGMKPWEWWQR